MFATTFLAMVASLIIPSGSPQLSEDTISNIQAAPPSKDDHQHPILIEHHLVNLALSASPLLEEIRYATNYNFTGKKLYPFPAAWLHRNAADALAKIQNELAKQGLGLKIYDAYRPIRIQQEMWNRVSDARYVADPTDPETRGRHTHGTAVDVTLVNKLGQELPMPSDLDDFSEKAHLAYTGGTEEQNRNRKLLQDVMTRYGFVPYIYEWWHFDFEGWENYPVLNISFEDLLKGNTTTTPILQWPE